MFRITIFLKTVALTGIQALDFCRSKGLADSPRIFNNDRPNIGCNVDEAFVRSWFDSDSSMSDNEAVDIDMLVSGELVLSGPRLDFAELSDTRIKELFIAAKFRRLTK